MSDQNNAANKKVLTAVLHQMHSLSSDVVHVYGSFLGPKEGEGIDEAALGGTNSSGVERLSAGIYRVRLNVLPPTQSESGSVGLLLEPRAYVVSETIGEFPASVYSCICSPYDAVKNAGTFDVATVVGTKPKDIGPTDRVFYSLAFRNVGNA